MEGWLCRVFANIMMAANIPNGRLATQSLCRHYDCRDQRQVRIVTATNILQTAHYQGERTHPWEKYATQLKGAFETLHENGEPKQESEK